jgi:hypothetical protein
MVVCHFASEFRFGPRVSQCDNSYTSQNGFRLQYHVKNKERAEEEEEATTVQSGFPFSYNVAVSGMEVESTLYMVSAREQKKDCLALYDQRIGLFASLPLTCNKLETAS